MQATWMWADLWTPLARMNPVRWSQWKSLENSVADLEICGQPNQDRPVTLRFSDGRKLDYSNVSEAVTALRACITTEEVNTDPNALAAAPSSAVSAVTADPHTSDSVDAAGRPSYLTMESAPLEFNELSQLSTGDLNDMLQNSRVLDDWMAELHQIQTRASRLAEIRQGNYALASQILARQAEATRVAQQSEGHEVARLRERVEALLVKRDALVTRDSATRLGSILADKACKADAEGENVLDVALSAPTALEATALARFKQQYLENKIAKHSRLAIKARLEADETSLHG